MVFGESLSEQISPAKTTRKENAKANEKRENYSRWKSPATFRLSFFLDADTKNNKPLIYANLSQSHSVFFARLHSANRLVFALLSQTLSGMLDSRFGARRRFALFCFLISNSILCFFEPRGERRSASPASRRAVAISHEHTL